MRHHAASLTLAAVLAASASTAALAQADVTAGGKLDAGASVGADVDAGGATANAGAGAGVTGAAGAQAGGTNAATHGAAGGTAGAMAGAGTPNYGEVIASLRSGGAASADIEALDDDVSVNIILLSELRGEAGENAQAMEKALVAGQEEIADLRSSIAANASISTALEAEGYTAEDVVAAGSAVDGELTLIVDADA